MALNKEHPDEAYQLGRLFAALEKTQEDASDVEAQQHDQGLDTSVPPAQRRPASSRG